MAQATGDRPQEARRSSGQGIVEYAVLMALISAALIGIQVYARRGLQAGIKIAADQLGGQVEGMRYDSGDRTSSVIASGSVLERQFAQRAQADRTVVTDVEGGGLVTSAVAVGGDTTMVTDALTDPGADNPFCQEAFQEASGRLSACAAVVTAVE